MSVSSSVPQLILSAIALVACILLLGVLIFEFHFKKDYIVEKPNKLILISSYIAAIFFSGSMISNIVNLADPHSFAQDIINGTITITFWSIAQLSVFVLIIARIHYVLRNTKFELKEANYIIFGILIFVCVLLCILWILRSILYYHLYINGPFLKRCPSI